MTPEHSEWRVVAHLADIPRSGARVVATPEGDVAIFRTSKDEVFALLDRCPHRGGPLSQGLVCDDQVICPLHNWCIDLRSGAATGPDEGAVPSRPVRAQDGLILMQWAEERTGGA